MEYEKFFTEKYRLCEDPWEFETNLYEKVRHAAMAEFVAAVEPRAILDLGCGEGHFLSRLLTRLPGISVTGVELVPTAADRCRRRLVGQKARIITEDLLEYLGHDDLMLTDAVICGDVLYYLAPDIINTRIIPAISRLLNPGGGVILSYADVNDHGWLSDLFSAQFHQHKQVYIKPEQAPPPWPWVVALFKGA